MDKVLAIVVGMLIGSFLGAIAHERDMYKEYQHDKNLTYTSWVTDWDDR